MDFKIKAQNLEVSQVLVLEYLDRNEEHKGAYEHFYRHNSFSHNISHLPSEYFEEGKLMWKLKEVKEEYETDSEIKEESFDSDDDSYTERESDSEWRPDSDQHDSEETDSDSNQHDVEETEEFLDELLSSLDKTSVNGWSISSLPREIGLKGEEINKIANKNNMEELSKELNIFFGRYRHGIYSYKRRIPVE